MAKKRLRLIQDILQFERTLQANGNAEREGAWRFLTPEPFAIRVGPIGIKQWARLDFVKHRIDDLFVGFRRNGGEADGAESDGNGGDFAGTSLLFSSRSASIEGW